MIATNMKKFLITESQLNDIILIVEDSPSDYIATDSERQRFFRNKAGYDPVPSGENKPKRKIKYVNLMQWKSGNITKDTSWEIFKQFPRWSFAQKWINDNVYPNNKKYYKIVPVYE